jgi:hypothetical protein
MKECANSDSMMSQLPISESCVIKEMMMADDKAKAIHADITNLKTIICELHQVNINLLFQQLIQQYSYCTSEMGYDSVVLIFYLLSLLLLLLLLLLFFFS